MLSLNNRRPQQVFRSKIFIAEKFLQLPKTTKLNMQTNFNTVSIRMLNLNGHRLQQVFKTKILHVIFNTKISLSYGTC